MPSAEKIEELLDLAGAASAADGAVVARFEVRYSRFLDPKGKAVKQGVKVKGGRLVKAKSRTLEATGRGTKLVEKAVKQALVRTSKIAGKKLRFKLSVTDASGKTTKLKLATKAKP